MTTNGISPEKRFPEPQNSFGGDPPSEAGKLKPTGHVRPAGLFPPSHDIKLDRKPADIMALVASLLLVGMLMPVLIFRRLDGKWEVIDGWTRVLAALQAGLETIPVHDLGRIPTDVEKLVMQTNTNLNHATMTDHQLGEAIIRYMKLTGCRHQNEAGRALGVKSDAQTSRIMNIHKSLCEEGKVAVLDGTLPFTSAASIARLPVEAQKELIAKCVAGLCKRDSVAGEVNILLGKLVKKPGPMKFGDGKATVIVPKNYTVEQIIAFATKIVEVGKEIAKKQYGAAAFGTMLKPA